MPGDYWSQWGGKSGYVASQQQRYIEAQKKGDTELMRRLEADAARVGYTLPKTPSGTQQPSGSATQTSTNWAKQIQQAQRAYALAKTPAEREAAHQQAEAARRQAYAAGISEQELAKQIQQAWEATRQPSYAATAMAEEKPTPAQIARVLYSDQGYPLAPTAWVGSPTSGWAVGPGGELFIAAPGTVPVTATTETGATVGGWYNPATGSVTWNVSPEVQQALGLSNIPGQVQYTPQIPVQPPNFEEILSQIQSFVSQATPETGPVLTQFYNQTLAAIQEAENRILGLMQQQMGGVDPATQAALASLRETVQRQRQDLMEEMSRRGLLQSGIWLEMEDRLNRGELTETQRLLADRLSALQNQLINALATFGQMRVQAAQQFGIEGLRQIEAEAQRRQQAVQDVLQRAWEMYQYEREYPLKEFQVYGPYYVPTQEQWLEHQRWLTETFGQAPPEMGQELVQARSYAAARGASVDWDPKTKEVIINGVRIKPEAVGGKVVEGTTWLPRWAIDRALGLM